MNDNPRVILALAAEADDRFIWDQLRTLPLEMFGAGPVQIKFAYFGAEGALQVRPYIATRWVADADALADIMDRGRAGCVCGCSIEINDILEHALQEAQQGPVQAVVIIGDRFHGGDLDSAIAAAKQLRARGTQLFVFQQDDRRYSLPIRLQHGGIEIPWRRIAVEVSPSIRIHPRLCRTYAMQSGVHL